MGPARSEETAIPFARGQRLARMLVARMLVARMLVARMLVAGNSLPASVD